MKNKYKTRETSALLFIIILDGKIETQNQADKYTNAISKKNRKENEER